MKKWSYSRAGVSLEKHKLMHEAAARAVSYTLRAAGVEAGGVGGYSPWLRVMGLKLALHMDGVGTKTLVLEETGRLWVAGWDCVAMNVNDLAVAGFKPIALSDYIAMPRSDVDAYTEIMEGIARAAVEAGAALVGGETAILPDLANGYDVVCAALGVPVGSSYPGEARPGDVLLGVASNGLHANGYSLARKILLEKLGGYSVRYGNVDFGEELSKPTLIYSKALVKAIEKGLLNAAAHITGGGFTKIKRMLGPRLHAIIEAPEPPPVFTALMELGDVEPEEMYRVFNMGVGLVLSTPEDKAELLEEHMESHGFKVFRLGRIVEGPPGLTVYTPWGGRLEY